MHFPHVCHYSLVTVASLTAVSSLQEELDDQERSKRSTCSRAYTSSPLTVLGVPSSDRLSSEYVLHLMLADAQACRDSSGRSMAVQSDQLYRYPGPARLRFATPKHSLYTIFATMHFVPKQLFSIALAVTEAPGQPDGCSIRSRHLCRNTCVLSPVGINMALSCAGVRQMLSQRGDGKLEICLVRWRPVFSRISTRTTYAATIMRLP